jgi:hypothetical protein
MPRRDACFLLRTRRGGDSHQGAWVGTGALTQDRERLTEVRSPPTTATDGL